MLYYVSGTFQLDSQSLIFYSDSRFEQVKFFLKEYNKETKVDLMDEATLINKLRLIEALFSGAATDGEKIAAERARQRIMDRLKLREQEDPPIEYSFSMSDMWSRKVFTALLRRYGITPYRYHRQRYTTVMARISEKFVDETLWPEFLEISDTLETYLSEVTDRVVSQVIHKDSSEAEVVEKPLQLPHAVDESSSESSASSEAAGKSDGKQPETRKDSQIKRSRKRSRRKGKKRKKRKRH